MASETLIDALDLKLDPQGLCLWGPTLIASDLCLGGRRAAGASDAGLLSLVSRCLRERKCSRLVLLGRLFSSSADPEGDLPGLLVPWRSEILDQEIIWVFPKPMPGWAGILEFLEVKPAPSGSMLGEAQLLSVSSLPPGLRGPVFVGGISQKSEGRQQSVTRWWASQDALILPSLGGQGRSLQLGAEFHEVQTPKPSKIESREAGASR